MFIHGNVFVVHPVREDLSAALRYGIIRYVNKSFLYPDQLGGPKGDELPPNIITALNDASSLFDVDRDHLMMIGDYVQMVTMAVMIAGKCLSYRVLRYDRQAEGYISVKLPGLK